MNAAVIGLNAQMVILFWVHQMKRIIVETKTFTRNSCRYVSGIDDENPNSPHLPELEFDQPVIQFDIQQPNQTIKQLALIGTSTWALLKRDMAIMYEC